MFAFQLHLEVKDLKEENARLKVTADQAVYLAEVVEVGVNVFTINCIQS